VVQNFFALEVNNMYSKKTATWFAALLILSFLAACTGGQAQPTPDVNLIFTQAAQTVAAQLTQTAAAQPTNTPQPTSTNTPEPSPTQPILTGLPLPGAAGTGTAVIPTLSLPTLALATATRAVVSTGDKCVWQRNDPADGSVIDPKKQFDIVWYLQNSGTTTWTKNYKVRYYVGDLFVDRREVNLPEEVQPNQVGRAIMDATAPATAGTYKATFVLTNEQGINFCVIDFTFTVGSSALATNPPTATPISLDYICNNKDLSKQYSGECANYCPQVCANWYSLVPPKACYVNGVLYENLPTCDYP
jgi:hypothetical protein